MSTQALSACIALLPLVLALGACTPTREDEPEAPAASTAELRTLARGDHTGLAGQRTFVARSPQAWRELWSEHASPTLPPPEAPTIDFSRDMVAGIALGPRPSAGYAIQIERAERIGERLILHARATEPPPDMMQAALMTSPFHFVALPRHEGSVEFRVR